MQAARLPAAAPTTPRPALAAAPSTAPMLTSPRPFPSLTVMPSRVVQRALYLTLLLYVLVFATARVVAAPEPFIFYLRDGDDAVGRIHTSNVRLTYTTSLAYSSVQDDDWVSVAVDNVANRVYAAGRRGNVVSMPLVGLFGASMKPAEVVLARKHPLLAAFPPKALVVDSKNGRLYYLGARPDEPAGGATSPESSASGGILVSMSLFGGDVRAWAMAGYARSTTRPTDLILANDNVLLLTDANEEHPGLYRVFVTDNRLPAAGGGNATSPPWVFADTDATVDAPAPDEAAAAAAAAHASSPSPTLQAAWALQASWSQLADDVTWMRLLIDCIADVEWPRALDMGSDPLASDGYHEVFIVSAPPPSPSSSSSTTTSRRAAHMFSVDVFDVLDDTAAVVVAEPEVDRVGGTLATAKREHTFPRHMDLTNARLAMDSKSFVWIVSGTVVGTDLVSHFVNAFDGSKPSDYKHVAGSQAPYIDVGFQQMDQVSR